MSSVGKISLDLNINNKNFNKQVDGIQKKAARSFDSTGKAAKKSAGVASIAVGNIWAQMIQHAAGAIKNFVASSIEEGSNLAELQNVVDSVFTTMADKVDNFSKTALDNFGLTEGQAKRMVGTFGAMSKAFGYTEEQAFSMSTALAGLAGDVASFYNLDIDTAYTKMKSVFSGETESLKDLGVVMTQAALDEFALANNYKKTTAQMSEREKVALRLAFVQDKLKTASGDVIRTQDSWANQVRKLEGQISSFKAALGQGFINVLTPVIKALNVAMAKLIQLANAFKSFTESVMGNKNKSSPGAVMGAVAEAAGAAADSTAGIEDAANGAAGAAKKAQKALMGFDEINKLSSLDVSGEEAGDASFGSIDFGEITSAEEVANKTLEKVKEKVNEIVNTFKEGLIDGLGEDFVASLNRIRDHIFNIGQSLKDIFSDPEVVSASKSLASNVAYSLGEVTGAALSIGASIGENLFGGISKYLEQNKAFITEKVSGILESSAGTFGALGGLADSLASIFEVMRGDVGEQFTSNLIAIITNATLGVTEVAVKLGEDIVNSIATPIEENKDKIKLALEETLEPINSILDTLNTGIKDTMSNLTAMYDEKIKPFFEGIAEGISLIVDRFLTAWNTHMVPVLDAIAVKFKDVWENKVQPAINKVIEVIGKAIELITWLWKNVLVPVIGWIVDNIVPIIAPICQTLIESLIDVFGALWDGVKGIFTALGGLIDFIMGIFTGDWKRSWEGIKSIFEGIWKAIKAFFETIWISIAANFKSQYQGLKGVTMSFLNTIKDAFARAFSTVREVVSDIIGKIAEVFESGFRRMQSAVSTAMSSIKTTITNVFNGIWTFMKNIINTILGGIEKMVNGVIDGFNTMIKAMNNLSFKVPDWVPNIGGESFGFDLKTLSRTKLPRLAEGGYVKANQPQPVIVGDNKTQGEIISPEGKMLDVVLLALKQFFSQLKDAGYSTNDRSDVGDIVIPIYLDGSMLDEVIVTAQQRRTMRSGGR